MSSSNVLHTHLECRYYGQPLVERYFYIINYLCRLRIVSYKNIGILRICIRHMNELSMRIYRISIYLQMDGDIRSILTFVIHLYYSYYIFHLKKVYQ